MINASARGNYLNKTTTQVNTIIEDLTASEKTIETNLSNPPTGMYELNAQDNLFSSSTPMSHPMVEIIAFQWPFGFSFVAAKKPIEEV